MPQLRWIISMHGRAYMAGLGNALVLALQLVQIIHTHKVAGLSIPMFAGFLFIQLTFMEVGWKTKQRGMFIGMLASALITVVIITLIALWK